MRHVLVVDDDPAIASLIGEMLAAGGYAATIAHSYVEALDAAGRGPVDLVISDVVLGLGGDGLDVVEGVRALHPAARTLFVSGFAQLGARSRNDPVLAKPFSAQELLDSVGAALSPGE